MLLRIYRKLASDGIGGLYRSAMHRVAPRHLRTFSISKPFIKGRIGLEIGGPSDIFKPANLIPVYPIAARVDNCNFSTHTTWEGEIRIGDTFHFDERRAPGKQWILEASALTGIASDSYDFVLSSHVLEHIANPLQALAEWARVLRGDGLIVLVVPDRTSTFDHCRPVTSLTHLIQDYERGTNETDISHLDEILELHDLVLDPAAGDYETFKARSLRNPENRCLHHHVFDTALAVETMRHIGLCVLSAETAPPHHIIVVAQKARGVGTDLE